MQKQYYQKRRLSRLSSSLYIDYIANAEGQDSSQFLQKTLASLVKRQKGYPLSLQAKCGLSLADVYV
jgi:hypothetical protein